METELKSHSFQNRTQSSRFTLLEEVHQNSCNLAFLEPMPHRQDCYIRLKRLGEYFIICHQVVSACLPFKLLWRVIGIATSVGLFKQRDETAVYTEQKLDFHVLWIHTISAEPIKVLHECTLQCVAKILIPRLVSLKYGTQWQEEVGHGHVTYVRKRIHAVSLRLFLYWKNDQNFLGIFSITPKELVSFESASGVESEYPVNPVQPLGHFGCRAAWKSGVAEKPVKRWVTAGETGCLCSSSLPSAICTV